MKKFKVKKKSVIYDGKIVKLVVSDGLIRGRKARWEVVHHSGSVGVVPFLSKDKIILVEQFRYPVGETLLEIPAGTLRKGERPHAAASREIIEETGFSARRLDKIYVFYPTPGVTDEIVHIYKATGLSPAKQNLDYDEDIKVKILRLSEALRYIKEGKIKDAKTIIGLLLMARGR